MIEALSEARLVIEDRTCSCGNRTLRIHRAGQRRELRCTACDYCCGLLTDETTDFILAVCRGYGPPTSAIVLRRPRHSK